MEEAIKSYINTKIEDMFSEEIKRNDNFRQEMNKKI